MLKVVLTHWSRSWGILILAGLGATVYTCFHDSFLTNSAQIENGGNNSPDVLTSFASCTNLSPFCLSEAREVALQKVYTSNFIVPREVYQTCECSDFCGLLGPDAPMRKGANMVAWTISAPNVSHVPQFYSMQLDPYHTLVPRYCSQKANLRMTAC